eukprot:12634742-Ditylum_brightwellii.AAC.1
METNNFLFIGSYRDNEIGSSHPLTACLDELKRREITITDISISCISKVNVNALISDTLSMPQHMTKSFSDIVCKKTGGNPLFVTQFLQSLWDEGILVFSLEDNTWKWDADASNAKEILDDVGVLMADKIRQLPIR